MGAGQYQTLAGVENMDIIIQPWWDVYETDFKISVDSLIKNTVLKDKIIFVTNQRTDPGVRNQIKRYVDQGLGVHLESLKEAKQIIKGPTMIMRSVILFYAFWQKQMERAIKEIGEKYNYVPGFVNVLGEQLSPLDKMYPNNLLFDLDYNRVPVNRKNINYFNRMCEMQWKEIKSPNDIITVYSDKSLEEKQTVCVLSCALAQLKR